MPAVLRTFTLARNDLAAAMAEAVKIVPRNGTIPIVGNVLLAKTGDACRIEATDLDLTVRAVIEADGADAAFTVDAGRLNDIVRKLPDGAEIAIGLAAEEKHATFKCGRSRFSLLVLPARDFPEGSAADAACRFTISGKALAAMIAGTGFAVAVKDTRYYLDGLYLHRTTVHGADRLTAVATDGHRLALARMPLPDGAADMPAVIVPRITVATMARLAEAAGEIAVAVSDRRIEFSAGNLEFASKLIDGTYPDYMRVVPQGNDKHALADRAALAAAADRVATIATERGRALRLSFEPASVIRLSAKNADTGEAEDEVPAEYDGDGLDIGFNARYLAEALARITGDKVDIALADPGSPTLFTAPGNDDHLIVLMPMRVS